MRPFEKNMVKASRTPPIQLWKLLRRYTAYSLWLSTENKTKTGTTPSYIPVYAFRAGRWEKKWHTKFKIYDFFGWYKIQCTTTKLVSLLWHLDSPTSCTLQIDLSGQVFCCKCWIELKMLSTELTSRTSATMLLVLT